MKKFRDGRLHNGDITESEKNHCEIIKHISEAANQEHKLHPFVYLPSGGVIALMIDPNKKLKLLKAKVEQMTGVPIAMQLIIYSGRILHNRKTLQQCNC